MNKVEMQIINYVSSERDPLWFQAALESVKLEPVDLKIFTGKKNYNFIHRKEFIDQCKTEYLCWVDDDDEIIPGTVQKCLDFLELPENKNYCGVYTNHYVRQLDGSEKYFIKKEYSREDHAKNIHRPFHFLLTRTEAAKNYIVDLGHSKGDLFYFLAYASLFGDWKHLDIPGYIWRNHPNSHGKRIPKFSSLLKKCEDIIVSKNFFTELERN